MRKNIGCALVIAGGLAILYELVNASASLPHEPNPGLLAVAVALGVVGIFMLFTSWYADARAGRRAGGLDGHHPWKPLRRKWPLLLPIVLGALAFFPMWFLTPPEYCAVATVRHEDYSAFASTPSALVSSESMPMEIQAIEAEVRAWPNLHDVITETKQDVDLKTPADWQIRYDELRKAIVIRAAAQARGIDIIEFQVTLSDPDLAQRVANTVATNFVERSKSKQRSAGLTVINFLTEETDKYRNLLRDTENSADLPEVKNGIRNQLLSLRISQDAKGLELKETEGKLDEAEAQLAQVKPSIRSETTSELNPTVTDLTASLTQMERTLQLLLATYGEDHPDVVKLRKQIAAMKEQLAKEPERINTSEKEIVNPQYTDLETDISRLKQEIKGDEAALLQVSSGVAAKERELTEVVKQETHYNDSLRNQTEYNNLYTQYRGQLDEAQRRAKVQEEEYVTKVELSAPALKPAIPYQRPAVKPALACVGGGIAVGLMLMFGLAFCRRLFGNTDAAAAPSKVPEPAGVAATAPTEVAVPRWRRRLVIGCTVLVILLILVCLGIVWWAYSHPA